MTFLKVVQASQLGKPGFGGKNWSATYQAQSRTYQHGVCWEGAAGRAICPGQDKGTGSMTAGDGCNAEEVRAWFSWTRQSSYQICPDLLFQIPKDALRQQGLTRAEFARGQTIWPLELGRQGNQGDVCPMSAGGAAAANASRMSDSHITNDASKHPHESLHSKQNYDRRPVFAAAVITVGLIGAGCWQRYSKGR